MKVVYDAETETLTITLRDEPVRESEEERSGVILDYAADGTLVGLEILDATRWVPKSTAIEIAFAPPDGERAQITLHTPGSTS